MTNAEKEKHLMISIIIVSALLGATITYIIFNRIDNNKIIAPIQTPNQSQNVNINTNNEKTNDADKSNKINLNTATEKMLISLPTIGKIKGKDIINYRSINGNFKNISELLNVKGITENNIKSIINLVEVY